MSALMKLKQSRSPLYVRDSRAKDMPLSRLNTAEQDLRGSPGPARHFSSNTQTATASTNWSSAGDEPAFAAPFTLHLDSSPLKSTVIPSPLNDI